MLISFLHAVTVLSSHFYSDWIDPECLAGCVQGKTERDKNTANMLVWGAECKLAGGKIKETCSRQ